MAAGSIIIDLLMKTGSFETDSKRAEKRLREMEKTAKQVGTVIGTMTYAKIVEAVATSGALIPPPQPRLVPRPAPGFAVAAA